VGDGQELGVGREAQWVAVEGAGARLSACGNCVCVDGAAAVGRDGIGRRIHHEGRRRTQKPVGRNSSGQYHGGVVAAVWAQKLVAVGADSVVGGGEGDTGMRVASRDLGRGFVFSGVPEIGCGHELRGVAGVQSCGGDVRGVEDADGRIISTRERLADGPSFQTFKACAPGAAWGEDTGALRQRWISGEGGAGVKGVGSGLYDYRSQGRGGDGDDPGNPGEGLEATCESGLAESGDGDRRDAARVCGSEGFAGVSADCAEMVEGTDRVIRQRAL